MFGKNLVTSEFPDVEGSLVVNDLFYTIQGEGPDAGCPAVFLRLSKCNLRCYFCDTEFEKGEWWSFTQVVGAVMSLLTQHRCTLLVITGGEPCLQNFLPLVREVNRHGVRVSIETAGTVYRYGLEDLFGPCPDLPYQNRIVCSPKTPLINHHVRDIVYAYKYILNVADAISDRDGLPLGSTQRAGVIAAVARPPEGFDLSQVYVQPCDVGDPAMNKANQSLARDTAMKYGYRVSMQIHKLLDVP